MLLLCCALVTISRLQLSTLVTFQYSYVSGTQVCKYAHLTRIPMPVLTSSRRAQLINTAKSLAAENSGASETLRNRGHAVRSSRKFVGAAKPTEELVLLYVVNEIERNRKISGIKTYLAGIKKFFRLKDLAMDMSIFDSPLNQRLFVARCCPDEESAALYEEGCCG